ncbi:putative ribonuclease H-like domain-containing protein [Tanacetum coccineum]
MLADSKLPTTFWAEAVNTACYVQNKVLVVKPYNKTPYELFRGTNSNDFVDGSLFDSSSKNASNDEPQPPSDARKKDDEEVDMSNITTTYPVHYASNIEESNIDHVIGKTHEDINTCLFACFLSQEEPKRIVKALSDSAWVEEMQKELLQFKLQKGHTQEEGIDYDEVFAPVARIKAIRLFLAYASFMEFMVYQMDVKSAFLYGRIKEEVYTCQPLGFEDPDYPDKVYKVVKALYGLHQAPRAWYETLVKYLLDNGFHIGKIDQTLFIKKQKGDILLVQVYVDDIIFGFIKKELCTEFKKMMHDKFQMSSMGELTFFLGLQVKLKEDRIFISQDKYVADILRKFSFTDVRIASTLMDTEKPLLKDSDGDDVDVHLYRSVIGSLMYLTSSKPYIMFVVCACARFQVTPKVSHLHDMKRIFRYLKGQPKLGLWYPRDSSFDLVAYFDSDYTRASLDRKSTTGDTARTLDNGEIELTAKIDGTVKTITEAFVRRHLQLADADGISSFPTTEIFEQLSLMGNMKRASKGYAGENVPLFPAMIVQGEGSTHPVESHHTPTSAPSTSQPPTLVADEAASTGVDVKYGGATTTITGLEAGHGSGNIDKTPAMPYDSLLPRVNTLGSDEGSMTLQELMVLCTTLSMKVESLETDLKQTKKIYGAAYTRLIKKVKKLEKTAKSSQARRRARIVVSDDEDDLEDPSNQGREIAEIDQDPGISLVQHDAEIQGRYGHDMEFNFDAAKEVTTASVAVSTVSPTRNTSVSTLDDITMAETMVYIRKSAVKDKGKGKMAKSETIQTKTKLQQEQERLEFEATMRLQAEFEEEERQSIVRVHKAASSFNVEEWEDIQARVKADKELVQRLQSEEREKYTEAEQARMLEELVNQRKRYFTAQRPEERRNKPPTQAQQRTYMSNYIKNMRGYTLQQLRGYSFDKIKTLFETTIRKVNTFVPIESEVDIAVSELVAGSSKRAAEEELDQESFKRQKTGESSELAEEPRDKEADELP